MKERQWCSGHGEGGHMTKPGLFYNGSRRCVECESIYRKIRRAIGREEGVNPILLTGSAYWLTRPMA